MEVICESYLCNMREICIHSKVHEFDENNPCKIGKNILNKNELYHHMNCKCSVKRVRLKKIKQIIK